MEREQKVIMLGCMQVRNESEEQMLNSLLSSELDWGYISGELIHHRLLGYFYFFMENYHRYLLPEFLRSMHLLVAAQRLLSHEKYKELQPILDKFENEKVCHACLKGLVYEMQMYPIGIRRSNDCDIFVAEDDLTRIDKVLRESGYIQSLDGKSEASKREKLIQRMNYHDTVPYVKQVDGKLLKAIRVDINFHIDGKDNDISLKTYDYGTDILEHHGYRVRCLKRITHFLHLCIHFHREASNSIWTRSRRDVLLYKIVDMMNTLLTMSNKEVSESIDLAETLNVSNKVCFSFYYLSILYPESIATEYYKHYNNIQKDFLNQIIFDDKNIVAERKTSFYERAFDLKFCMENLADR